MTTTQIALRLVRTLNATRNTLRELTRQGITTCLTPDERRSRIYSLTGIGQQARASLASTQGLNVKPYLMPTQVDWQLYSWVCYTHRKAVLLMFEGAMQPARIKRRARFHNPKLRMSFNNCRDVIKRFLQQGIVQRVYIKRKAHPHYQLTETGKLFQMLLRRSGENCELSS